LNSVSQGKLGDILYFSCLCQYFRVLYPTKWSSCSPVCSTYNREKYTEIVEKFFI